MLDLTLLLAIAKVVMDKFFAGAVSKLGEQTIDGLPQKVKDGVQRLGQLLWQRGLSQKPNGEALLQQAAAGSATHQQELKDAIAEILADSQVMQQAQQLATEIHQTITIAHQEGKNQMNVEGGKVCRSTKSKISPLSRFKATP